MSASEGRPSSILPPGWYLIEDESDLYRYYDWGGLDAAPTPDQQGGSCGPGCRRLDWRQRSRSGPDCGRLPNPRVEGQLR